MVTTKGMFGVFARVKKISWSIKKKKRKIVLELPYPQSEFPISNFFFPVPVIWRRECLMKNDIFRVMLLPAICGYFQQRKN